MWTAELFIPWCLMYWTPVVSQSQNSIKARIGQKVSIPCPLDIPQLINIAWYRCAIEDECRNYWDKHRVAHIDNKTVYVHYPKKYELETNGTLTILETNPEDDKILYICKGKIQFSETVDNVTILEIIKEPPKLSTRNPPENEVIEGMPLMLQFKVHGYPNPLATLRHNKTIVLNETNMELIYIRHNASKLYNGDYTLTAENPLGDANLTIKVKVIPRAGTNCTTFQGNGTADIPNTEGSRDCLWKVLVAFFSGLLGTVLFLYRSKVWELIKRCHHSNSQTSGGSCELPTAHSNKGHYAQSGDTIIGESQVESDLGCDGEGMAAQAL